MTFMGDQYVVYGGLKLAKNGKVEPTDEVYLLRLSQKDCSWTKVGPQGNGWGENGPLPRSQHVAVPLSNDKLWIFGGHYTPSIRLNDIWTYDVRNNVWSCPPGQDKNPPTNKKTDKVGPCPRANSAAVLLGNKIYLFGGHGGYNYQRAAFNDFYSYDLGTNTWELIPHKENTAKPPDPRGGHSMFVIGTKIFVYGGWNTAYQFETLFHYDTAIGEWWEPEVNGQDIVPVWNHSACLVQAIPSAKYFVFGGESTAFPEGGPRGFGEYSNHIRYLDTADSFKWSKVTTEDAHLKTAVFPKPREYSSMSYDAKNSRLIIFGGWANEWLNDVYILNVSSVVGPPYSISEIIP